MRRWLWMGALAATATGAQDTVRFVPTTEAPTFAKREPVLRVKPGTVLISKTNFGAYYTPEGGPFPGEVGPIFVEGATTNDHLKVEVIRVMPNYRYAAANVRPNFGGLQTDSRLRLLNPPIGTRRYLWELDTLRMVGRTTLPGSGRDIEIDLQPMLGRLAVAPRGDEQFGGLWPGDFGGNMDAPEVRPGTTVYLPVFHDGAYLYFGDGHARQGQGEIAGTGLETSMDVILRIDVVKGQPIDWPRLEDAEHIMVAGSARPLMDAFRTAHVELIEWMTQSYGFDALDAYALLGQVGESTVANVVDPQYTVLAKVRKKYLGPRR